MAITLIRLLDASRAAGAAFIRAFGRGYDASGGGSRWPLVSSMYAPNAQSLAARGVIARRASWLASNSPAASAYVESLVTNCIGDGPTVRSAHPDPAMRGELEARFNEWSLRCDIEGVATLTGILANIMRSLVRNGEAVIHTPADGNGWLQVRLLKSRTVRRGNDAPGARHDGRRPTHHCWR